MATSTFASCCAAITLVIVPVAVGVARKTNATIPTTRATATRPMNIGTIGGRVHLALSISSDMEIWPRPRSLCCCAGDDEGEGAEGGGGEGGTELISSGIRPLLKAGYSCEMQDGSEKCLGSHPSLTANLRRL